MTPTRYSSLLQVQASPFLASTRTSGFPVGTQMVPSGTIGERFLNQTASFLPSGSDSYVQRCSSNSPSHSQNSLPLRVRFSAWSNGNARWANGSGPTIHWKRRVINSGVINSNVINSTD